MSDQQGRYDPTFYHAIDADGDVDVKDSVVVWPAPEPVRVTGWINAALTQDAEDRIVRRITDALRIELQQLYEKWNTPGDGSL